MSRGQTICRHDCVARTRSQQLQASSAYFSSCVHGHRMYHFDEQLQPVRKQFYDVTLAGAFCREGLQQCCDVTVDGAICWRELYEMFGSICRATVSRHRRRRQILYERWNNTHLAYECIEARTRNGRIPDVK